MKIPFCRLPDSDPEVALPTYETAGAAGADIRANLPQDKRAEGITLQPMERELIPTGLSLALPHGWEMQVRPRSGLALKKGLTIANAPGTVDADYRGEVGVVLINLGHDAVTIGHGDRIAQVVFAQAPQMTFEVVDTLPGTHRGSASFGSTGVN